MMQLIRLIPTGAAAAGWDRVCKKGAPMDCTQMESLREAYLAGTLDVVLYLECALHLGDCASCRRQLVQARARAQYRQSTGGQVPLLASLRRPPGAPGHALK
jgi:hypothetical protein